MTLISNPGIGRRLGAALLALLIVSAGALTGCGGEREPAAYIEMLAAPAEEEETARRAIEELTRMYKEAMPQIADALESENPLVRERCLRVLTNVRRMRSVELAGRLVDDPVPAVRRQAIKTVSALAQVWKEKSVELLGRALELDDPEAVRLAAQGLADMRYEGAETVLRQTFQRGEGVAAVYSAKMLYQETPSEETAQLLLEKLGAEDEEARQAALISVYGKEKPQAEGLAIQGLRDQIVGPLIRYVDNHPEDETAQQVLHQIRDSLIYELENTLDAKRAAQMLDALGRIADQESVQTLIADLNDTRLESSWRVAAAEALGVAAGSPRVDMAIRDRIVAELSEVLDQTATDNRVRIGAAISLARLRRENGVQFLLDSLDRFEEAVEGGQIAEARLQDLTRLRISSQEALTASGSFVVDFLRERIAAEDAGPIIVWAAAKTMGELGVEESADRLGRYLTEKRENPEITLAEDGATSKPVVLENWEDPTEEAVAAMQDRLEVMAYPDYVRWTCALALGRIGGESASELLEEAESIETEFLRRLRANRELAEFRMREPVINGLIRRHEDVLFYIRLAQQEAE